MKDISDNNRDFKYCEIKQDICEFIGLSKGEKHCGLQRGKEFENLIRVMKKCPKK